MINAILKTNGRNQTIIVRVIVGLVFLSEGIQKFLFPEFNGTGRFEQIGFVHAQFWAYFTATFEIICGMAVIIGLVARLASIPLFIIMLTAFVTTKWPILTEKGFWAMAHAYRTDFAMTLLLIYLMIYGAGNWSVDAKIYKPVENHT